MIVEGRGKAFSRGGTHHQEADATRKEGDFRGGIIKQIDNFHRLSYQLFKFFSHFPPALFLFLGGGGNALPL